MFKIYEKYIVRKFLSNFLTISLIFFSLAIVLNIFEEISFFKNSNSNFLTPYFLTILNAPITLFEIFPFIFLLSTQYFFYDIFKKDELSLLKNNGLSNLSIIKTLFVSSFVIGLVMITLYYNIASKLKYYYTDIKNNFSNDNKYLAVVNESGLWLKDETENSIAIIKSENISNNFLLDVIINEFDFNFKLLQTIQAKKIDINEKKWVIYNPIITKNNVSNNTIDKINFETSFDDDKIKSLFSNFSTLNLLELFNLIKDYENLGYSSDEIQIHLFKLFSTPFFYALMTVLSSIIMINIKQRNSIFFNIILGIFVSVVIYYLNYMFVSLGNTGKIPATISIFLPILFISIITIMGLVKINEK
jgi:lipopolysaccharide export system permease protein